MKICNTCKESKENTEFCKSSKHSDGLFSNCRNCESLRTKTYHQTIPGLIKLIYQNQRMNSRKKNHGEPAYTQKELLEWAVAEGVEKMWESWKASGYDKWLSPSVDRLDNKIGYSLANIQLVTWRTNLENQKKDNISGKHLHPASKSVNQLTLHGVLLATYASASIALRAMRGTSGSVSNITQVCNGKLKSAYGFKWEFSTIC